MPQNEDVIFFVGETLDFTKYVLYILLFTMYG